MKLWEAVATGKPFKRPCWDGYIKSDLENNFIWVDTGTTRITRPHDFNYDDYEIEPEIITFECAWKVDGGRLCPIYHAKDSKLAVDIMDLFNKRTKVTVEVLDE